MMFCYFWTSEFIAAFGQLVLALTFVLWYVGGGCGGGGGRGRPVKHGQQLPSEGSSCLSFRRRRHVAGSGHSRRHRQSPTVANPTSSPVHPIAHPRYFAENPPAEKVLVAGCCCWCGADQRATCRWHHHHHHHHHHHPQVEKVTKKVKDPETGEEKEVTEDKVVKARCCLHRLICGDPKAYRGNGLFFMAFQKAFWHIGSAAAGSLIIAIVKTIRYVVAKIQYYCEKVWRRRGGGAGVWGGEDCRKRWWWGGGRAGAARE